MIYQIFRLRLSLIQKCKNSNQNSYSIVLKNFYYERQLCVSDTDSNSPKLVLTAQINSAMSIPFSLAIDLGK